MSTEQLARLATEVSRLASLQLAQDQGFVKLSEIQAQGSEELSLHRHVSASRSALVSAARVAVASGQGLLQPELEAVIKVTSALEVGP